MQAAIFGISTLIFVTFGLSFIPPQVIGDVEIEAYDIRKEMAFDYSQAKAKAEKEGKDFNLSPAPFRDYFPVYIVVKNDIKWKFEIWGSQLELITTAEAVNSKSFKSLLYDISAPYLRYKEFFKKELRPDQKHEGVVFFEKNHEQEKPVALIFESKHISPKRFKKIVEIKEKKWR